MGARIAAGLVQLRSLYVLPPNLWTAFAIYFPLGFINVTSFKLYLPLLRSLVVCDVPVGTEHAAYSGSIYCGDRNLVLSVALQQEAWLVGIKLLLRMLSGPILGALCDRHGRKPILMMSIAGITVSFFLMLLACVSPLPPMVFLTVALVIQGSTTAFGLCFKAIVADSLEKDERAKGFVVLNHVDVLSRGCTIAFVIYVQKVKLVHYEWLCLAAGLIGLLLLLCCHMFLQETLRTNGASKASSTNGAAEATTGAAGPATNGNGKAHRQASGVVALLELLKARLATISVPTQLLSSSRFLQLRILQMILIQLGTGWESVQDTFMISVLRWDPGDWDLVNVPISSFREVWGMITSGFMVQWAKDPANCYWYICSSLAFNSGMLVVQSMAPFGAVFMLLPRCLLALVPSDGGADAALFSGQFPAEEQASATGLLTATDNLMSGLARWLYARFLFDPAAQGWAAGVPLFARTVFTLLGNAVCFYVWRAYGRKANVKKVE